MAYEFLSYEKRGRIAYVTINRPERMNALHPPANAEMLAAFTEFRDDPEAWIAILTGTGDRAFSAGNDLRYTAEQDQERDRPASAGAPAPFWWHHVRLRMLEAHNRGGQRLRAGRRAGAGANVRRHSRRGAR